MEMLMLLMLLLQGLCCSGVLGALELAFLTEPRDVIAVRDRPLMLHCQVEGEGPISITWRHNGVPIVTGVRATVLKNGTLLIRNFSKRRESNETDAGEYDCAAENRYGLLISRKARVQLASLPKFLTHPQSLAVDVGGVARLSCQVNGIPEANITWQRDRRPLSTADPRYTLLPNGVLQITGVQRSDSGLFRCVASNIANTRYSNEAQLSINVAGSRVYKEPVILSGPQNLTINVHQTAILECIATGNPRPIVSWSRLDGRSIGVEGVQVLGTGNLMISDATLQHSGVYVCSANRPGSRSRRTALGRLVVQAPPEFVQWPQSVSRPAGGSAVFSCTATGVPEPHLIWLKNGKLLTPSGNVKLTNGNTTLAITRITPEDEAIYQCIAENSAGTNQASARLAIVQGPELPEAPTGLRAVALSSNNLQLTWDQPEPHVSQQIIGYVLHIRRLGEPDGAELQEAVDKSTFVHAFENLEAATTYSIYLKAYSAQGGSQQSSTITATTLGGVPSPPSFFTKVLNQTAMQVYWELPSKPGKVEGFRLEYRAVSNPDIQGQEFFPGHINTHTISHLEPAAVYEIQLVAFNGNGDSPSTRRLVSLSEDGASASAGQSCNCDQSDPSMSTLLVGVHSGLACILCCLLFVLLAYRRSFICRKEASWETPPTLNGVRGPKSPTGENIELNQRCDSSFPPVMVMIESPQPVEPGTGTG
ncbi:PREDICTED: immunoglobulin superfamily DCC subclass member 3-like [Cyprinodon variegatus]|uniref:immunoglobulin superfamily DCC subclass member 3-like n=1 Tax=Cyprinodon variegatus TaxID=28743 RepID=UPI000742547E|nr:PREDICTED: immunoglobulin superfamily DCC subclass member 3-like [Cyprinodon variegatus]